MASINFRLRSQIDKNVSIYIHLTLGRDGIYETPTGFYINPKDWKEEKKYGFPKNSTLTEIKILRGNLNKLTGFIDTAINDAQSIGKSMNTQWLKSQIETCFNRDTSNDKKCNLLTDYIQKIIDKADTKVLRGGKMGLSKNRVKGYVTFKGTIKNYQKYSKKQIDLKDIDIKFEEDFKNWLIKKKEYSRSYAGKIFDNLKAVCKEAQRTGYTVNEYVNHLQSFTEKKDEKEIIALSFGELDTITNLRNDLSESLKNVRKWLLLGCEIGQRGGDLLSITENNLRTNEIGNKYIDITQQKTGKQVTIRVTSKIEQILQTGFPYKISMQKFNKYLKDLCEIAKIDEQIKGRLYDKKEKRKVTKLYKKHKLIASHVCRRSFATNYYDTGIPMSTLMKITGHTRESTFLVYIGKKESKDQHADFMYEHAEIMAHKRQEKKEKEKQNEKVEMKPVYKKVK